MGVEELGLGGVGAQLPELEFVDVEVLDCWIDISGPLRSFAFPFLFDALGFLPEDFGSCIPTSWQGSGSFLFLRTWPKNSARHDSF